MLDIELLTHGDYFVGTTNSGLPHVVDVLRFAVYNKDRTTFVDASERHLDFGHRLRRFWHAKVEGAARRVLLMGPSRSEMSQRYASHQRHGQRRLLP